MPRSQMPCPSFPAEGTPPSPRERRQVIGPPKVPGRASARCPRDRFRWSWPASSAGLCRTPNPHTLLRRAADAALWLDEGACLLPDPQVRPRSPAPPRFTCLAYGSVRLGQSTRRRSSAASGCRTHRPGVPRFMCRPASIILAAIVPLSRWSPAANGAHVSQRGVPCHRLHTCLAAGLAAAPRRGAARSRPTPRVGLLLKLASHSPRATVYIPAVVVRTWDSAARLQCIGEPDRRMAVEVVRRKRLHAWTGPTSVAVGRSPPCAGAPPRYDRRCSRLSGSSGNAATRTAARARLTRSRFCCARGHHGKHAGQNQQVTEQSHC